MPHAADVRQGAIRFSFHPSRLWSYFGLIASCCSPIIPFFKMGVLALYHYITAELSPELP